ncbi:hypothetical protein D3C74_305070 [compost metagenome]
MNRLLDRLYDRFSRQHLHRLRQVLGSGNSAHAAAGFGDFRDFQTPQFSDRTVIHDTHHIHSDPFLSRQRRSHHRTFSDIGAPVRNQHDLFHPLPTLQ